ncbi:unnamed protein product, partial [Meganyctiphanes norvegica]
SFLLEASIECRPTQEAASSSIVSKDESQVCTSRISGLTAAVSGVHSWDTQAAAAAGDGGPAKGITSENQAASPLTLGSAPPHSSPSAQQLGALNYGTMPVEGAAVPVGQFADSTSRDCLIGPTFSSGAQVVAPEYILTYSGVPGTNTSGHPTYTIADLSAMGIPIMNSGSQPLPSGSGGAQMQINPYMTPLLGTQVPQQQVTMHGDFNLISQPSQNMAGSTQFPNTVDQIGMGPNQTVVNQNHMLISHLPLLSPQTGNTSSLTRPPNSGFSSATQQSDLQMSPQGR